MQGQSKGQGQGQDQGQRSKSKGEDQGQESGSRVIGRGRIIIKNRDQESKVRAVTRAKVQGLV